MGFLDIASEHTRFDTDRWGGRAILGATDDAAVEYLYFSSVSDNPPVPHTWFVYPPYGFEGDMVWLIGMGFGDTAAEYVGRVILQNDYAASIPMGLLDGGWDKVAGTANANTPARTINIGSDIAPPVIDVEHQRAMARIPEVIVPPGTGGPQQLWVALGADQANASNRIIWPLYPILPDEALGSEQRFVSTESRLTLSADSISPGIEQRYAFVPTPLYVVSSGAPSKPARLGVHMRATAKTGTWSIAQGLSAAEGLTFTHSVFSDHHRWLPDPATVVAHPELGTGVSLWAPSQGGTGQSWRFEAASAPYIDPAYLIDTRLGPMRVPAMIFDGNAWARLLNVLSMGPSFTIAMVVMLHSPPTYLTVGDVLIPATGISTLLSTDLDGSANVGTSPMTLDLWGEEIFLTIGTALADEFVDSVNARPVIIVLSVWQASVELLVTDQTPSGRRVVPPSMHAVGQHLLLGRGQGLAELMNVAAMDVLDLTLWDEPLGSAAMIEVANRYDSVYGVTGATQWVPEDVRPVP